MKLSDFRKDGYEMDGIISNTPGEAIVEASEKMCNILIDKYPRAEELIECALEMPGADRKQLVINGFCAGIECLLGAITLGLVEVGKMQAIENPNKRSSENGKTIRENQSDDEECSHE